MQRDKSLVSGILDEILEYVDSYGVVQVCRSLFNEKLPWAQ